MSAAEVGSVSGESAEIAESAEIEAIESRLLAFIRDELIRGSDAELGREDDLLDDRLDSVAVLRLAGHADREFGLVTRPEDFVIENFRSVAALAAYVHRAGGRAGDPSR